MKDGKVAVIYPLRVDNKLEIKFKLFEEYQKSSISAELEVA